MPLRRAGAGRFPSRPPSRPPPAVAAVALAFWAADLSKQLDDQRAASRSSEEVAQCWPTRPRERIPLDGADGVLVVDAETGNGWLVVCGLEEAPAEQTYEAWVIQDDQAVAAGLFSGGDGGRRSSPLDAPVPEGAVVAVTVEQCRAASTSPTQQPIITSRRNRRRRRRSSLDFPLRAVRKT